MKARLLNAYRSQYPVPLRFHAGEIVQLGVRDEEWPDFAWVKTGEGRAGWAPVAWLRPLGASHAEALRDYSAQELDVDSGESVQLHHEHGGWGGAERANGARGWLPARDLELLEENP